MDDLGRRKRKISFSRKWMRSSLFIHIFLTLLCILAILRLFTLPGGATSSSSESSSFLCQRKNFSSSSNGHTISPLEGKYLKFIQSSIKKYEDIYPLDPLFVLSIIKAESDFQKYTISSVGAAGVAQLMPITAKEMGMKVFLPSYYEIAWQELKTALGYSQKVQEALGKISFRESKEYNMKRAEEVISYRKLATRHQEKANKLFQQYKEDLLVQVEDASDEESMGIDQRFIISLAIDACVKLLADNARRLNNEDIREIASAYNAGLGKVLEFQGIPFIEETVIFQNRVMNYYRQYLMGNPLDSPSSQFSKKNPE